MISQSVNTNDIQVLQLLFKWYYSFHSELLLKWYDSFYSNNITAFTLSLSNGIAAAFTQMISQLLLKWYYSFYWNGIVVFYSHNITVFTRVIHSFIKLLVFECKFFFPSYWSLPDLVTHCPRKQCPQGMPDANELRQDTHYRWAMKAVPPIHGLL